ncbi:MAG TPA: phthalyl amidase [Actinomycetes bacterium]
MGRSRIRVVLLSLAVGALVAGSTLAVGTAGAAVACAAPVPSTTQPGYTVADPNCDVGTQNPFVPLTDANGNAISTVYTGITDGSAWRIEVPKHWNHDLVLWAHGFRGTGTTVFVDSHPLRQFLVQRGFAWAASSYQTNGYDVGHGVTDSHALIALFRTAVQRAPRDLYMTGASMGGHITAVEIEHYRHTFAGAMPFCGVLGDTKLFDHYLDANVTAAALTGTQIQFPPTAAEGQAYAPTFDQLVLTSELPKLGSGFNTSGVQFTDLGRTWEAAVEQRSGGTRPGFDSAFAFWNSFGFAPLTNIPFLFGLYPGLSGGTIGIASGNVTSNVHTVYQLDDKGSLTPQERQLNRDVLRVAATAGPTTDLSGIPGVFGDPRIPVLSMHDVGDLFVPFSMEQIYAVRAMSHHQSGLFVSRAIRGNNHCGFTAAELTRGFDDLVAWVRGGHRPAGDAILDRHQVAKETFGCRFTDGPHPEFVGVPCP